MEITNSSVADIDTGTWYNWQQQAVPVLLDLTFEACGQPFRSRFGLPFFTSVLWYRSEGARTEASWLLRNDEGVALGRLLTDVLAVPSAANSVEREFVRAWTDLLKLCRMPMTGHDSVSGARRKLRAIARSFLDFYAVGAITEPVQFYCERTFTRWLQQAAADTVRHATGLDTPSILSALTSTSEELYATTLQRELLSYAIELEDDAQLDSAAAEHAARYFWRTNNYGRARTLTAQEVRDEVLHLRAGDPAAALEKLNDSLRAVASRRALVLQHVSERIRALSLLAERFGTVMADRRKAVMNETLGSIQFLAELIARQNGLPWNHAAMLSPSELADESADFGELRRRAEHRLHGYVQVLAPWPMDDAEMLALVGSDEGASWGLPQAVEPVVHEGAAALTALDDLDRRLGLFLTEREEDSVSGSVVQVAGLTTESVVAPACIVLDPVADAGKFRDGDVLVATSTTPDFLPIMSRASAIVTNMGGMFQHAAHFAREHKLPCIIGCGSATAAFKDGELVEVDLRSGVVRRKVA